MEGKPRPGTGPKFSVYHTISETLLLRRHFEFFFLFSKWCWTNISFSKILLPFQKKKQRKFTFVGQSVVFILIVWWIFPFHRCLYSIIFGKVLFPASPKSVMRWRMIWTHRGFVAGKISPLRGSKGVIDTKLMADLTDARQESKKKVTWALEFSAHF